MLGELQHLDGRYQLRFRRTLAHPPQKVCGWHACLDMLGHELAGEEPPWSPVERWEEVHAGYFERLGPDASTTGPPESAMKAMKEEGR